MKSFTVTFLLLAFTICYSSFSQPAKIEVYGDQILDKSYLGNGVQWSAYPQFDISEKSWERVFERTDFMRCSKHERRSGRTFILTLRKIIQFRIIRSNYP